MAFPRLGLPNPYAPQDPNDPLAGLNPYAPRPMQAYPRLGLQMPMGPPGVSPYRIAGPPMAGAGGTAGLEGGGAPPSGVGYTPAEQPWVPPPEPAGSETPPSEPEAPKLPGPIRPTRPLTARGGLPPVARGASPVTGATPAEDEGEETYLPGRPGYTIPGRSERDVKEGERQTRTISPETAEQWKADATMRAEGEMAAAEELADFDTDAAQRGAAATQAELVRGEDELRIRREEQVAINRRRAELTARRDEFNRQADAQEIDPDRFYGHGLTFTRIAAAISMALGAYGATLGRTENFAEKIIRGAIDDDIAAQRENMQKGERRASRAAGELESYVAEFGSQEAGERAYRVDAEKLALRRYQAAVDEHAIGRRKLELNQQLAARMGQLDEEGRNIDLQAAGETVTSIKHEEAREPRVVPGTRGRMVRRDGKPAAPAVETMPEGLTAKEQAEWRERQAKRSETQEDKDRARTESEESEARKRYNDAQANLDAVEADLENLATLRRDGSKSWTGGRSSQKQREAKSAWSRASQALMRAREGKSDTDQHAAERDTPDPTDPSDARFDGQLEAGRKELARKRRLAEDDYARRTGKRPPGAKPPPPTGATPAE